MIVDCHNDLLTELEFVYGEKDAFRHRWLDQLVDGGVGLQVCPIFVGRENVPFGATTQALRQAAAFHRAARETGLVVVSCSEDVPSASVDSPLALMLSMESADALNSDPYLADVFWELGVRMLSLTWNDRNPFADGTGESPSGGLSVLGRRLVDRIVSLGYLVDLAHAGRATFGEILDRTDSLSVMVSHASCRAVFDTPRNLDDQQLLRLAERGSVVGMMAHPLVVDPETRTISRYVDHIVHAATIMGIEHVGIGADFIQQVSRSGAIPDPGNSLLPAGMELEDALEGFAGPGDYPRLVDELARRHFTDDEALMVLSGNFLRLFRERLPSRTAA